MLATGRSLKHVQVLRRAAVNSCSWAPLGPSSFLTLPLTLTFFSDLLFLSAHVFFFHLWRFFKSSVICHGVFCHDSARQRVLVAVYLKMLQRGDRLLLLMSVCKVQWSLWEYIPTSKHWNGSGQELSWLCVFDSLIESYGKSETFAYWLTHYINPLTCMNTKGFEHINTGLTFRLHFFHFCTPVLCIYCFFSAGYCISLCQICLSFTPNTTQSSLNNWN